MQPFSSFRTLALHLNLGTFCSFQKYSLVINLFCFLSGLPPYPLLKDLSTEEKEHLENWLDSYHIKDKDTLELRPIVGYLKEFHEQQNSRQSNFRLPPR